MSSCENRHESKRQHVVEAIVFRRTDPILFLLLRRIPARGGWWQAVTGSVEENEELETAVRREVWEETGITSFLEILDLGYSFEFEFAKYGSRRQQKAIKHSFGVETDLRHIQIGPEHDACNWITYQEALGRLTWEDNKEAFRRLDNHLRDSQQKT